MLQSLLKRSKASPATLLELLDPDNANLFPERDGAVLVTPRVSSYLLAHVALRPQLNGVFELLFGSTSRDIELRPAASLELTGRSVTFAEMQHVARARGMIALGVMSANDEIALNPARSRQWTLTAGDRLIVL